MKAYNVANRDKRLARDAANQDKIKAYRIADREKSAARQAAYRERHPEKKIDAHLRQTYGLTIADYNAILESQGGVCKICREPWNGGGKKRLAVDHCHATGKIRGLLCDPCNVSLGNMRDNPALLIAAAAYLTEHQQSEAPA